MVQMLKKDGFIGVFDSGVGGITVLGELMMLMPRENYVYFGDSLHAPYGTKNVEEIRALTLRATDDFVSRGAKALVVACNTATSAAVKIMRTRYPNLPIIGIEPAIKPASLVCDHPTVLVMATPATLNLEKFHALVDRFSDRAHYIPLPCPELVTHIESGLYEGKVIDDYLSTLFAPYQNQHIDAVVLGCTHFPHVADSIAAYFGNTTAVIDGGKGTALETRRRILEADLLADECASGSFLIENSAGEEKINLCKSMLETYISKIKSKTS